ncbi:MAG: hypothetical protein LLG04_09115 [Parachlamydia sp.]|nr:hypothetical protein [Parachlamydia sp.]
MRGGRKKRNCWNATGWKKNGRRCARRFSGTKYGHRGAIRKI